MPLALTVDGRGGLPVEVLDVLLHDVVPVEGDVVPVGLGLVPIEDLKASQFVRLGTMEQKGVGTENRSRRVPEN